MPCRLGSRTEQARTPSMRLMLNSFTLLPHDSADTFKLWAGDLDRLFSAEPVEPKMIIDINL